MTIFPKLMVQSLLFVTISIAVVSSQSIQTINVVFVNEEHNQVGDKAIDTTLTYVSKNPSLGIKVDIHRITTNRTDSKGLLEHLCNTYRKLLDDGTPPNIILDFTMTGMASETVKSFAIALAIPTVSASFGQEGDLRQWRELTDSQRKYLVQIMPPADVIPEIIRSLVSNQQFSNAAILFDDTFVFDHKYKSLLQNIPCRHLINRLEEPNKMKPHFENLHSMELTNFFILGNLPNLRAALDTGCQLNYFGRKYSWYLITQEKDDFKTSCKNASVVFIKPAPDSKSQDRLGTIRTSYSLNAEPEIAAAFYFDLALKTFMAVKNMITDGSWPKNLTYLQCDDFDGKNSPPRFGLNLVTPLKQNFSEPDTYGSFNITSNGESYMNFNMTLSAISIRDGALDKTELLAVWSSGLDHNIMLVDGIDDLANFTAHKLYRVVTKVQPPFVYKNAKTGEFYGYCIDLLNEIAKMLNFDYEIYEVPDGKWGNMDEQGNWNGVIKELMDKKADVGIGSISVMAERENVIDFTAPFYDLVGISILMKKPESVKSLFKFLTVLDNEVWLCILGAYFFTSFLIYIFDRFSPYSYQNNMEKYKDDDEKRLFNVKECLWFSMTSLTPQGGGEAPKNLSGRLVAATWWLFGFIIIASYTANLAAFLTVSRLESPIDNLDDLAKQFKIGYAPINGSSAMTYFERMAGIEERFYEIWKDMSLNDSLSPVERAKLAVWDYPISDKYTKIWQAMKETGFPKDLDEAIERVESSKTAGDGFALLADATDVRYQQLTNCKVQMVGEEFSKKPYAIALQSGSPLKDQFNSVVLTLLNKRQLEKFKEKWWNRNPEAVKCEKMEDASDGISIENIGGVFIVIFIGIGLACATLAFEYYYYKNKKEAKIRDLQNELMKYGSRDSPNVKRFPPVGKDGLIRPRPFLAENTGAVKTLRQKM